VAVFLICGGALLRRLGSRVACAIAASADGRAMDCCGSCDLADSARSDPISFALLHLACMRIMLSVPIRLAASAQAFYVTL